MTARLPPVKAVVFDVDGVLLDLTADETGAFVGAFERCFAIDHVNQDWNVYRKRNDIEIAREILERALGREPDRRELARVLDEYVVRLEMGLSSGRITPRVRPGTEAVLEALQGRDGLALALATANLRAAARLRLSKAGLWRSFSCGGFAEDGEDKSAILRSVIEALAEQSASALRADEIVFIGDQPSDLRAAQDNGTGFIGIADEAGQRNLLKAAGAGRIMPRLSVEELFAGGWERE